MITAKLVRVRAELTTRMVFLIIFCIFLFQSSLSYNPRPALDIDKNMRVLPSGNQETPGWLSSSKLDRFVKSFTFWKRSGDKNGNTTEGKTDVKTEEGESEKKSFASYRWRPAYGR